MAAKIGSSLGLVIALTLPSLRLRRKSVELLAQLTDAKEEKVRDALQQLVFKGRGRCGQTRLLRAKHAVSLGHFDLLLNGRG
jgi:hypothetical protein